MDLVFANREQAGRLLSDRLKAYVNRDDVVVLGLPRGGVPVAYEVAQRLRAPLDVFMVRKLGVAGFEELAFGAIASGGVRVLNDEVVRVLPNAPELIEQVTAKEWTELERRERSYRDGRPPAKISGRTVILVDDGVATGATMRAAVEALRKNGVARVVVAVPVGAPETCRELAELVDEAVCLIAPAGFYAVGQFYEQFSQVSDQEVRDLLERAARAAS
jgi:predicted phosphoribosyltransferase